MFCCKTGILQVTIFTVFCTWRMTRMLMILKRMRTPRKMAML